MRKGIVGKIINEDGNLWVTIHEDDFFYILGVARDQLQIDFRRDNGSGRYKDVDNKLIDAYQTQINRIDQALELVDSYDSERESPRSLGVG